MKGRYELRLLHSSGTTHQQEIPFSCAAFLVFPNIWTWKHILVLIQDALTVLLHGNDSWSERIVFIYRLSQRKWFIGNWKIIFCHIHIILAVCFEREQLHLIIYLYFLQWTINNVKIYSEEREKICLKFATKFYQDSHWCLILTYNMSTWHLCSLCSCVII